MINMSNQFPDLIGHTFVSVTVDDCTMTFTRDDGKCFVFLHRQDCCENVYIESVVGDLADLVGAPILIAEESINPPEAGGQKEDNSWDESYTWTFYKFATRKGYVDVRWYGSSNGYYSESVDFVKR